MTADLTVDPARLAEINHLTVGGHVIPEEGFCLLEAVAHVAGEDHTDRPACVSPLLGQMGRELNDRLPDGPRQKLIALIPDLPGTAGDGHDAARSYMALDWVVRAWLPAWLELVPACSADAARVRAAARIVDLASAKLAAPVVREARETAAATATASGAARRLPERLTAHAAAVPGGAAAWAGASMARWTIDNRGGCAGWDPVGAGEDAAFAATATRVDLGPTVEHLQRSVIGLYRRMILVGRPATREVPDAG